MDAVALVRRAGDDLVEEGHLAVLLGHGDVEVLDARERPGQIGELVVVGGEQRLGAERGVVVDVLGHGAGDGEAVVGARASSDLVEDDERPLGGVAQDLRRLHHLDHERRLSRREVVLQPHAGEDAVDDTDARRVGGHEAADLRKQDDERHLTQVGGLARHVGAGEHDDARPASRHLRVVGHEPALRQDTFDHGMPPVNDFQLIAAGERGADVAVARRGGGEAGVDVGFAQGRGGGEDGVAACRDPLAEPLEQRRFDALNPVLRVEDRRFVLLELGCDVALRSRQCLPADVVVGDLGLVRPAHFDVVAKDAVVADLERLDAGAFPLLALQRRQMRPGAGRDRAKAVELLVDAGAQYAAIAQRRRRIDDDGLGNGLGNVGAGVESRQQVVDAAALLAFRRCEQRGEVGHRFQPPAQRRQITRRGAARGDPARETLQVGHRFQ